MLAPLFYPSDGMGKRVVMAGKARKAGARRPAKSSARTGKKPAGRIVKRTAKQGAKKSAKRPLKKPSKRAASKPKSKSAAKVKKNVTQTAKKKSAAKRKSTTKPASRARQQPAKKAATKVAKKSAKKSAKKAPKTVAKKVAKKPAVKAVPGKPASKPAKKVDSKVAKKVAKKAPKQATKPAPVPARKASATTATYSRKVFRTSNNKGVLVRLKRDEKGEDGEKIRPVTSTERSRGETPITLHHRKPTREELEEFRAKLLERRAQLITDVNGLEEQAFSEETQQVSTNHLADSSSGQYEQEFNLSLIENETGELKEIARALEKMAHDTYGVCESCGINISIERLKVMPYTRVCIHCRTRFEEEGGGEEFGIHPERRL
jgi:RNA polymerase-binding protein DksA